MSSAAAADTAISSVAVPIAARRAPASGVRSSEKRGASGPERPELPDRGCVPCERVDAHGVATLPIDATRLGLLGGTADTLFAARWHDDGASDILAIDRAGAVTTIGEVAAMHVPVAAVANGDHVALAVLRIESTADAARCQSNPVPCLAAETAVDGTVVAPEGELVLDLAAAGGRVFAATTSALVELP